MQKLTLFYASCSSDRVWLPSYITFLIGAGFLLFRCAQSHLSPLAAVLRYPNSWSCDDVTLCTRRDERSALRRGRQEMRAKVVKHHVCQTRKKGWRRVRRKTLTHDSDQDVHMQEQLLKTIPIKIVFFGAFSMFFWHHFWLWRTYRKKMKIKVAFLNIY